MPESASLEQSSDRLPDPRAVPGGVWRARSRWAVHLGLLLTAAASLGTLQLLHVRVAFHTIVGLVFVGLVTVHLAQRRRAIVRMSTQIIRAKSLVERGIRLAASDVVLLFLTVNVLVSGVVDWGRGEPTQLPFPAPLDRWHLDAGLALIIYLSVHAWHRRKRIRRSTIR